VIVVGGGVAQAGESLFVPLREALDAQVLPSHRGRCQVVPALLGERAGAVGAGLLAWEAVAAEGAIRGR
jgi:glucokinase